MKGQRQSSRHHAGLHSPLLPPLALRQQAPFFCVNCVAHVLVVIDLLLFLMFEPLISVCPAHKIKLHGSHVAHACVSAAPLPFVDALAE